MDMFQMHQQQHVVDTFVNNVLIQQQQQFLQQQLQNNHADCSVTSEQSIPHDWREDSIVRARTMEAEYNADVAQMSAEYTMRIDASKRKSMEEANKYLEEVAKFGNLDGINTIEDVKAYFDR